MATNINNLDNAMMVGNNRFQSFKAKFAQQWTAPLRDAAITAALRSVSPSRSAELQRQNPEAFQFVINRWGGG